MIRRDAEKEIKKLVKQFRVIAVTGPRQSGKTTLVKAAFPGYGYYNLEDLLVYDEIKLDPMRFARTKEKVIVDEVQRMPELFSAIQVSSDEKKKYGNFIISGSQNLLLSNRISQSLAGRAAYQVLLPFSISELKKAKKLKSDYLEQMWTGFYPEIYDNENMSPDIYYGQYIATYMERDLREITKIQNLSLFQKFIRLVAGRIGQVINYETLASDTGTSAKTIEGWLSVLEASYVIYKLKPYYENFGKRVIKAAKLYFIDTGLACYLLGIRDVNMLETHYLRGGLFENMIVMDIRKNLINNGKRDELYYFRDNNKNEVDLLLESEGRQIPIEIKPSGRFDGSYLKGINYFKKANEKSKDGIVVFAGSKSIERENYKVVSWKDIDKIGSGR